MNMWIKNSKLLKEYFPDFYQKAVSPDYTCRDLQVSSLDEGNLLLQSSSGRCYLHSRYDTRREMEEMFKDADDPEQILIIFGLGMGYCLEYIQERRIRFRKVIVLEPYNNIFREMLKLRDFRPLLKRRDVSIFIFNDARKIVPQIMGQAMTSKKVKFLCHLSYRTVFTEVYEEISRLFMDEKRAFFSTTATIKRFLSEWSENQLIALAKKDAGASCLQGKFEKVPAIIVSAGPSLEKRIDELKEIQDKALIIAPGTGAKICREKGIKAHIAAAIDASRIEAELVRDGGGVLVGSYRLHPEVDKLFTHTLLRINLSNDLIARYFHRYYDLPLDIISDRASVSSVAVDMAARLGCDPIILIGQDLCFYDNKMHAGEGKDSLHQTLQVRAQEARDINGGIVHTYSSFLVIRRDMELMNLGYGGRPRMINATEAGLGIPGVENRRFSEVINEYISPRPNDVGLIIDDILSDNENSYEDIDIDGFYRHLLAEIEKLEEANADKLFWLQDLQSLMDKEPGGREAENVIEEIKNINTRLGENDFYAQVVIPVLANYLTYYKSGVQYNYADNLEDPAVYLYYESNVYLLTSSYIKVVKSVIEQQLRSPGAKLFDEGGLIAPAVKEDIGGQAAFTAPVKNREEDTRSALVLPFALKAD